MPQQVTRSTYSQRPTSNPPCTDDFRCCGGAKTTATGQCRNPILKINRYKVLFGLARLSATVMRTAEFDAELVRIAELALCKRHHRDQALDLAAYWKENFFVNRPRPARRAVQSQTTSTSASASRSPNSSTPSAIAPQAVQSTRPSSNEGRARTQHIEQAPASVSASARIVQARPRSDEGRARPHIEQEVSSTVRTQATNTRNSPPTDMSGAARPRLSRPPPSGPSPTSSVGASSSLRPAAEPLRSAEDVAPSSATSLEVQRNTPQPPVANSTPLLSAVEHETTSTLPVVFSSAAHVEAEQNPAQSSAADATPLPAPFEHEATTALPAREPTTVTAVIVEAAPPLPPSQPAVIHPEVPSPPQPCHNNTRRRRLPAEGGECRICAESLQLADAMVWCKNQCGHNFHKACWQEWRDSQLTQDWYRQPRCANCRADWMACPCDEQSPEVAEPLPDTVVFDLLGRAWEGVR